MTVEITPHPAWVAGLDNELEPHRRAILDTPVVVDASENRLIDGEIQNFLVAFYPIIRDFPQWLQILLDRSPANGQAFFRDNIRVESVTMPCGARWETVSRSPGHGFKSRRR
jgi:hypothetical protein